MLSAGEALPPDTQRGFVEYMGECVLDSTPRRRSQAFYKGCGRTAHSNNTDWRTQAEEAEQAGVRTSMAADTDERERPTAALTVVGTCGIPRAVEALRAAGVPVAATLVPLSAM